MSEASAVSAKRADSVPEYPIYYYSACPNCRNGEQRIICSHCKGDGKVLPEKRDPVRTMALL
jgi:hypothetical protein